MNLDALDSMCEKHENVRIAQLRYPKTAADFKMTCDFIGDNERRYRLEPNAFYQPHVLGHGMSTHTKLGGLDRFHTYTIWTNVSEKDRYTGDAVYKIYYAEPKPMELTVELFTEMCATSEVNPNINSDILTDFSWTNLRKDIKRYEDTRASPYTELLDTVPYFRMRLSRRLFRLFPQSKLMKMELIDFSELSQCLIKQPRLPDAPKVDEEDESAEEIIASLCFPWLQRSPGIPIIDIQGLFSIERYYNYAQMSGLGCDGWRDLMLCVELYQKALEKCKKMGHTFSTFRHLAMAYGEAIRWDEKNKPTVRHIVSANASTLTEANIVAALMGQMSRAVRLRIIKIDTVPVDEEAERVSANMQRVVYAMDDWMMQTYVTGQINDMVANRWRRNVHADGCNTPTDVHAKINLARPPLHLGGGPHWHAASFQNLWRNRLDEQQKKAVINIILNPVTFVTGPPGTGKTELFLVIKALFPTKDVIALAAYGRIAKMIDRRMEDGFTFHRAEALATYRSTSKTCETLVTSRNALIDEFGLVTHDHLRRLFEKLGQNKVRLVLAGDINQMGAIGSGSFIGSIYRRFGRRTDLCTELDIPHRFLPNHGTGMTTATIRTMMATRPSDPADPMAVSWNMRQIMAFSTTHQLDLVTGTAQDARFIIVPKGNSTAEMLANLEANVGITARDLLSPDIQILTHANATRRKLNDEIRLLVGDLPAKAHRFAVGEKITFASNKYLEREDDGDGNANAIMKDVEVDYRAMTKSGATHATSGQKRFRFDYVEEVDPLARNQPKKKRQRTDTWRGTASENVFNGDVKMITAIFDVNGEGKVLNKSTNTQEIQPRNSCRIITFSDSTQLNLDKYDVQKIESAVVLTATKFQGSEVDDPLYYETESSYIRRDQLYTCMTRGIKRFIWIGGNTVKQALENIATIVSAEPLPRRERFAYHINLATQQGDIS